MVEADLASRYGRRRDAMRTLGLVRFDPWLWPAAVRLGRLASSLSTVPHRTVQAKPLILRPGGMGDLILLCVAAEELGIDKRDFRWVIETRSAPWARHLGLDHVCYDEALLGTHWRAAGRYPLVINTEQRFDITSRWSGGRPIYITAAPLDRPFARRLADRLGASAELFEGDFDAVCELVRRSSDVLTIDSGFLHIASYYGVPVTSIFTS